MEVLFANFNGTLNQALQLGISLGVMVGIVLFAFVLAEGGRFRVFFGLLLGFFLMGGLQTVQVGQFVAEAYRQDLLVIGSAQMDLAFQAAISGFFRSIEAAIVGGLIMIVIFSPGEALRGAVIGFLLGAVSAVIGWSVLNFFDVYPPNYMFALALLVLGYLIYDTVGSRLMA